MNIFLRTFNNKINSKTGVSLPLGKYRGTPEWTQFEDLLMESLNELGHAVLEQPEHPNIQDTPSDIIHKRGYVHQCKRDKPEGDLFWMQMHMKYLFTLDTNGWGADNSNYPNGMSSFTNEEEAVSRDFCKDLSEHLLSSGESKCPQAQVTDMTPNRFILVSVQIPRDYTIKWHSPITVKYFIESIQAWAIETENHICFKMHPYNKIDLDLHTIIDEASSQSRYIHKVEGNIHELIKRASGLFVINSGTGFESLVHGKPVATFGTCDYNLVSFNADIRRLDEARNFIYSFKDEYKSLGYKFVHWYHKRFAYDVRDKEDCVSRLTKYLRSVL